MATVNKDFRIKHGLIVEGSTATVNGSNVLTEASSEFIQDTAALLLSSGTHSGISFTYDDLNNVVNATVSSTPTFDDKITFEGATADSYETILQVTDPTQDNTITLPNVSGTVITTGDTGSVTNTMLANSSVSINSNSLSLGGSLTLDTDDIGEGTTNLYYTEERVQDEINDTLVAGEGIDLSYNDTAGTLTIDAEVATDTNKGVASFSSTDFTVTSGAVSLNSESIQDIVGGMLTGNTETGITVTYQDGDGTIDFAVADQWAGKTTSDLTEGTNKYYTDERVDDRVNDLLIDGTGISTTYDDSLGTLTIANTGVVSLEGTANEVEVTSTGTSYTVGLPSDITIAGNITISGTPTNANHAATVAYVDAATFGLNVHDAVKAATTTSINIATDLENGDLLDGVTLATGMRVLVKNQSTKTQNGVYIVAASGAASRATDYDSAGEVDAGDFIFVESGTVNGKTGWVQTNTITTIGSDDIEFTQFSGAGTYQAGTGLGLVGNVFSIDTAVTVDKTTAQTLTNKTLTSPIISGLYLSDNNIIIEGTDDTNETTLTFTDPTQDNTITFKNASGTVAFTSDIPSNTDGLSEGTTNKYFTDERAQDAVAAAIAAGTHTNITITYDDNANSLSFSGAVTYTDENARDAIGAALTAGSGIGITVNDNADTITVANSGVLSITGTANQISATASTGDITLSLPQSIHTAATPTFAGLTLGSLTLTDALIGTATQALTDGSATVVDSWAVASYSSAKYIVQMTKGTDIEVLEVLVTVDGNNNVYLTEYADVISNTQLGTTDADYSSGNVRLKVTASNGTTVKVHKTLIEA